MTERRLTQREKVIQLLEQAEAEAEARRLMSWAGLLHTAAHELREAHRALQVLGASDPESESDVWTSLS
jgi:hypothetical protein